MDLVERYGVCALVAFLAGLYLGGMTRLLQWAGRSIKRADGETAGGWGTGGDNPPTGGSSIMPAPPIAPALSKAEPESRRLRA